MKTYTNPDRILTTSDGKAYLTLVVDHKRKLLIQTWGWKYEYGFDVIKTGCLTVVELVKKYELIGGISDLRQVKGTWEPVNEWLVTVYIPQLLDAGAVFFVQLMPKEFFANLTAELMEAQMDVAGLIIPSAPTYEDAFKWIENFKKKNF